MKRLMAAIALCLLPLSALAISPEDLHAVLYDSVFYDPSAVSGTSGNACQSLALPQISDNTAFAAAIDNYIKANSVSSPLAGMGTNFVNAGTQYGVNPAYVVAIAQKESSLGVAIPAGTYNAWGRTAAAGQPASGRWYQYTSWAQAVDQQTSFMKTRYLDQGLVTIDQITPTYAPPTENDTAAYIVQMQQYISSIINLAGGAVSCGGGGGSIVQIAQQELALHLVGTGSLQNGGPVCKYQGTACANNSNGEAWCADFTSWVYNQAGSPFTGGQDGGWRLSYTGDIQKWFQTNGVWVDNTAANRTANPPQPGDVFYRPSDAGHVGIVVSYNSANNTIVTIEGNAGQSVAQLTHDLTLPTGNSDYIEGWGRAK